MIKVVVGNNAVRRPPVIIDEKTTLRACLEQNEIDYATGTMHLDGAPLPAGSLDQTFEDLGVKEKCFLLCVAKTDNA